MSTSPSLELSNVTIGILTALPEEYAACRGVFDPTNVGKTVTVRAPTGTFKCLLCTVSSLSGEPHVVGISMLPDMGNNPAAYGTTIFLQHCERTRAFIMCGIAGAVPNPSKPKDHVRLGDVVVSSEDGVIQYDRGKQFDPRPSEASSETTGEDFQSRSRPRCPGPELLAAVKSIISVEQGLGHLDERRWEVIVREFIANVANPEEWRRPEDSTDVLNDSPGGLGEPTIHPADTTRRPCCPKVFMGAIGAANIVQSDPLRRNNLRDKHGIKAVEMEASGVADVCWFANKEHLIVRGTQDYCNSYKHINEIWRRHAALIAAAFARTVVEYLPSFGVNNITLQPSGPVLSDLGPTTHSQEDVAAQQVVADVDAYRLRHIDELAQAVREVLREGRLKQLESLCTDLECELLNAPNKSNEVRNGWIVLAQVEAQKALRTKMAGGTPDITRLSRFKREAENVID